MNNIPGTDIVLRDDWCGTRENGFVCERVRPSGQSEDTPVGFLNHTYGPAAVFVGSMAVGALLAYMVVR